MTRERVDDVLPKIFKRDERREDFQRDKLMTAVRKACEKRPVSTDALERMVDRVERHLHELGEKEVASSLVGERVMDELKALDTLAAARFASVFRDFQTSEDYAVFFASIESGGESQ